jgi:BirA family transcriptional regulator, biotin operon repressor / biotin---[acetyl-CoA-carboxylase] ligase
LCAETPAARFLDRVDSTNAEARRLAEAGSPTPLWVVAREQTAGRGRRARPWVSPPGNFYASRAARLDDVPSMVALRSFVAALALREALSDLTGLDAAFRLKWPNDVLLNGGKVAGILLEASGPLLVVGIGVNLIAAPPAGSVEPGALPPVDVLSETGKRLTPEGLLASLAPAYDRHEARLREEGFAPIRAAWLAVAARLGEPVRARTGSVTREGIFRDLDASGALVLDTRDGPVAIPAAEVFF